MQTTCAAGTCSRIRSTPPSLEGMVRFAQAGCQALLGGTVLTGYVDQYMVAGASPSTNGRVGTRP